MSSTELTQVCGTITLVGRPNAGKSTLINALVGHKIVGVSTKPQTTRSKVLGIVPFQNAQLLITDTPGMHRAKHPSSLHSFMNREAWESVSEAEVICYLVALHNKPSQQDAEWLKQLRSKHGDKLVLLWTQTDRMKKFEWKQLVARHEQLLFPEGDELPRPPQFFISAKQKESHLPLLEYLKDQLPERPWLYDPEQLTDRPTRFVLQEHVREALFRKLGADVPYRCAVKIEAVSMEKEPYRIDATILVARPSLKALILGKNGAKIKEIGIAARESIERFLAARVHLELFVRVETDWDQDLDLIADVLETSS